MIRMLMVTPLLLFLTPMSIMGHCLWVRMVRLLMYRQRGSAGQIALPTMPPMVEKVQPL